MTASGRRHPTSPGATGSTTWPRGRGGGVGRSPSGPPIPTAPSSSGGCRSASQCAGGGSAVAALASGGQLGGVHGGLGTPVHAELGEQVGDVVLHGLLGEVEPFADLAVGEPLGEQIEDPALLVGEVRARLLVGAAPQAVEDTGGDAPIEQRLAGGHTADVVDEVAAAHLLEDVTAGAGHD